MDTTGAYEARLFDTANSRFKQSSKSLFWCSMIAATALHFAVLAFWPNLKASDLSFTMDEIEAIELPPEIEIPPPPEAISRPANPVVTTSEISTEVTIAPTTWEATPIDQLPPPPTDVGVNIASRPDFTPTEVLPEVRNRPEVERALEREYPATLRDAGIEGRTVVYLFIDEEGAVQEARVGEPSDFEQFDRAALRVVDVIRFSPAVNQGQRVPVWIQLPIGFQSR